MSYFKNLVKPYLFSGKRNLLAIWVFTVSSFSPLSYAHHSFAMYDSEEAYVLTGIVTRVDPNPNHLQVFVAPLNKERTQVLRNDSDEPVVWAVEMKGAGREARDGVSVNSLPRGTIVSVGLHPLRNGFPGGGRGEFGFVQCPDDTPPGPEKHCDSVQGSIRLGSGELPEPTGVVVSIQGE